MHVYHRARVPVIPISPADISWCVISIFIADSLMTDYDTDHEGKRGDLSYRGTT